ncbi:MAG TPA: hypothetical protein DIT25_04645 [Candidatus Moranbacteria bacterium]|nr:hypothetical protein [Candidatus Moranbacteria bacterium]
MKHSNHKIEKINLTSGAKLVNIIVPDLPFSIISAWFNAGSRFDPKGKEGLAHFFEHLLMTKTKKFKDRMKRLESLESNGISYNAFTSRQACHYYQFQMAEKTYDSLEIFLEGLNASVIDEKMFESEKEIIIDEASRSNESPESRIWFLGTEALFQGSSLGQNFFGTEKSIKAISIGDMIEFKNKFYSPEKAVFVFIGNEPTKKIAGFINSGYKKGKKGEYLREITSEKAYKPERLKVEKRKGDRLTISINFKTVPMADHKEIIALDFIASYLADHWISRLNQKLRIENNYTYWVESGSDNFSDSGYLSFIYTSDKNKLNPSLDIAFDEIDILKNKNIPKSLFQSHKNYHKANISRRLHDPFALLWWYGDPALLGGELISPSEYLKKIDELSADEIRMVAKKYLTEENVSVAIIGNMSKDEVKFKL